MSIENLTKFTAAVTSDPELEAKVRTAVESTQGDPCETLAKIAAERNLAVSAEEFRSHAISRSRGEMDPVDLESISGGVMNQKNFKSPFE